MHDNELKRLLQADRPLPLPQSFYQRLMDRLSRPPADNGTANVGGALARLGAVGLRDAAAVFFVLAIGAFAWHQFVAQEDELHRIDTLSMSSLLTL